MNVLLISQCDKRALIETRRILDQFAERRGHGAWQTPITQAGLETLRRLLRKTARKNTAVACHWIRGKNHSELLWIVGNRAKFNEEGAVPTASTRRDVIRSKDENDWRSLEDIRLLAQLAALLHDLGKASVAFQARIHPDNKDKRFKGRNLYRHEWVSMRLFLAFVGDADTDEAWLTRLADPTQNSEQDWISPGRYWRDGLDAGATQPFKNLPPVAAAIAWLVVTHHRLPVMPVRNQKGEQEWLGARNAEFKPHQLQQPLDAVSHNWNEVEEAANAKDIEPYWDVMGSLPVTQPKWRAQTARAARGLLAMNEPPQGGESWLDRPYVMHLARLSLMLADHDYSSLSKGAPECVKGDEQLKVFANTDSDGNLKQYLDEHLLGVARGAGLIVHAFPGFEQHLPRLARHAGLRKRSGSGKFSWQDKAADAATGLGNKARVAGGFVINMASTGCGKTLANLRILNALADPQQGLRATYALGLRALTQQTGRSYQQDLRLGDDELAVLVGGSGSRELFDYHLQQAEERGSASAQALIEEDSHILYEGNTEQHPLLSRAMRDPKIRKLLSAPVLVCTVDHITPATESLRGGRQIAPMLRLMSSDLVLDELDDYDLADLPALTRLVHWAGLLGSRVVLSSATLPPSLLEGMFMAYRAGREQFSGHRGEPRGPEARPPDIPCLWADEFSALTAECVDPAAFSTAHAGFVARRAAKLTQNNAPLRPAELLPLRLPRNQKKQEVQRAFAEPVLDACLRLHEQHAQRCPVSGKRVSFGLVRMANIEPLINTALAMFERGAPIGTRIHLCVYHARFPLAQRSAIERQLDATFNRREPNQVFKLPEIRLAIDAHPESEQIFIVLASPVCEVGRDWDADWAVVEPSFMRSLIQLAGRVQRHRQQPPAQPNVLIFDTNLRPFYGASGGSAHPPAIFIRPGFEDAQAPLNSPFRFASRLLGDLLRPEEYGALNALPRVQPRPQAQWQPKRSFVDMEHARMSDVMLPRPAASSASAATGRASCRATASAGAANAASCWQYSQAGLTGMLPQYQPFRRQTQAEISLVFLPDEDEERLLLHRVEEDRNRRYRKCYVDVHEALYKSMDLQIGPRIGHWGQQDLLAELVELAEGMERPLLYCAERYATVNVRKNDQGWKYHPWLGLLPA